MSDIDKRLAAFRSATDSVTAPPGFKQRVLSKVRAAAILPLAAATGWFGGIGIKTLVAAAVIASGTAAYQLTSAPETPTAAPQTVPSPATTVASAKPEDERWAEPGEQPVGQLVVDGGPGVVSPPTGLVAARDGGEFDAGQVDGGNGAAVVLNVAASSGVGWGRCAKGLEVVRTGRARPTMAQIIGRYLPGFDRDLAAEPIPPLGSVYYGELESEPYEGRTDFGSGSRGLRIYPDGTFIGSGSPAQPLFIALPGHAPVLLTVVGPPGERLYVGSVPVPVLTKENAAWLDAVVQLEGPPATVTMNLSAGTCGPETAAGPRQPLNVHPVQEGGITVLRVELALVPHLLVVSAAGYAPRTIELRPEAGKNLHPNIRLEREVPLKAEFVTGAFTALIGAPTANQEVRASEPWLPAPGCPVSIAQDHGRYTFAAPVAGRQLGDGSLGVFQSSLTRGQVSQLGPPSPAKIEPNHVFLLRCPDPDRWVLVRFSR